MTIRRRLSAVSLSLLLSIPAWAAGPTPPGAPPGRPSRECAAPLDASPAAEVKLGHRTAVSTGYKLTFKDKDADGQLVLGVLGPINEDSGQNILALRRYRKFFEDQKADAIVITGDVPEVPEGIARALGELAESGLPVFVVIGNRDCQPDFTQGLKLAQQRYPNIINLNTVRAVEFPEATLVSLPGYHDPNFIQCATGCRYNRDVLEEVVKLAREAKGPVVLVSHGPPKGGGSQSIDYAHIGGNVGDPEINRVMKEGNIAFGLFSNIKEAGARATDMDGTTLMPEGTPKSELLLNPGPANSARQDMNDHTKGYGFAAVLAIQGKEASWKLYRAKPLTPDERKEARALDPKPEADDEGPARGEKPAPKAKPPPPAPPGRPAPGTH